MPLGHEQKRDRSDSNYMSKRTYSGRIDSDGKATTSPSKKKFKVKTSP